MIAGLLAARQVANRSEYGASRTSLCLGANVKKAPPPPPVRDVVDVYHGVEVTDPYRYMEDPEDPAVVDWMRAQAEYARSILQPAKRSHSEAAAG